MKSQSNNIQELNKLIFAAQQETTTSIEVSRILYQLQTELNAQYFQTFSIEDTEKAFKEIWKLLLNCASHSASGVRLSSYRLTGCFLLKIQPYYSTQIQTTFSEVSTNATIDMKSSAIIASSFAFLSKRISLPFLDFFLDSTPVYHHFKSSDPIFEEHLSSIISNLGELGFEWFSTLLNSYLALMQTTKGRYLFKSIAAIIKHDPIPLFNDVMNFVKFQNDNANYLALISFIINSNEVLQNENLELYEIAKTSMEVLEHSESYNATQVDSAMQILSIQSNSFKIRTELKENGFLEIDLNDNEEKITLDVGKLTARTSFYLFDLPLEISLPSEKDGTLTFSAKMRSLAKRVNLHPEESNEIFGVFLKYYSSEYNENVSAVLQGASESMKTLIQNIEYKDLVPFLENAIFSSPSNWFHSSDQLNLIKSIPPEKITDLFGSKGLKQIGLLLIKLVLSPNEQVSKKSIKVFTKLVTINNFKDLTLLISNQIDIYDSFNLIHLLPLLCKIVLSFNEEPTNHLNFLILQLFELTDLYSRELNVLTEIFFFLGSVKMNFVNVPMINNSFFTALSIIFASITCVTGFSDWSFNISQALLKNAMEMVDLDIRSKNIDVSSENSLNYDDFLRPCAAAMKFLYKVPTKFVSKEFILTFCDKLRNIFPYESALFIEKYWANFAINEKVDLLIKMEQSLNYIQSYDASALVCKLYIKTARIEFREKLQNCTDNLRKICEFVSENPRCTTAEQRVIFKSLLYFTNKVRSDPSPEFEKEVVEYIPELYLNLFNKLRENTETPQSDPQVVELDKFVFRPVPDLQSKLEVSDPCIKTQIIHSLREFTPEEYQELLEYYIKADDLSGIDLIIRCCYSNKISLSIDGLTFPKKSLPILIRYLKATNSPQLNSYTESVKNDKEQHSLMLQKVLIYANSKEFIEKIKTSPKVKKSEMKLFSQVFNLNEFTQQDLIDSVIHLLTISSSQNKLRYSLRLTMCILSKMDKISNEFFEKLISIFSEREKELDSYSVSFCLLLIAQKYQKKSDKLNVLITHLIASVSQIGPEICILYSALFYISNQDPLFNQTLPKIIEHLFAVNRPSLFTGGVQLFKNALEIIKDKNLDYMMKKCFPEIVSNLSKSNNLFTVSEKSVPVILRVFRMGQKKQQQLIFSSYSSIIPDTSSASFIYYPNLIGYLLAYCEGVKWQINDFNYLLNLSHKMITTPGNESLLYFYIKTISIRAEAIQLIAKRQTLVMNEIDAFLDKGVQFCDFYKLYKTLYEWIILIFKENGLNQTFPIVSSIVFNKTNRIFPAVAAAALFAKHYDGITKNSEEKVEIDFKEKLKKAFVMKGKELFEKNRARGLAVALLSMPDCYKTALNLALLEFDAEKSGILVEQILKDYPNLLD